MNRSTKIAFIVSFLLHISIICLAGFDHTPPPTKKVEISLEIDQSKHETPICKKGPAKEAKKKPVKKIVERKEIIKKKKEITRVVKKKEVHRIEKTPEPIMHSEPARCTHEVPLQPEKGVVAADNPEPQSPLAQEEKAEKIRLSLAKKGDSDGGSSSLIQWYLGLIWQKIEEAKVYPETARRNNQEGTVKVQFLVWKDGRTKEISIVKSSGKNVLDRASLETIKMASPFPPIPPLLELEEINVKIPIVFELERRG